MWKFHNQQKFCPSVQKGAKISCDDPFKDTKTYTYVEEGVVEEGGYVLLDLRVVDLPHVVQLANHYWGDWAVVAVYYTYIYNRPVMGRQQ